MNGLNDMIASIVRISGLPYIVLFLIICGSCSPQKTPFRGTVIFPIEQAPEIRLIDQRGNSFDLPRFRGKILVLFFGFSYCPDICPATLMEMKKVHSSLGQLAERVQFLFITVDPERDSEIVLKEYSKLYDMNLLALTGSQEELEEVYESYGVFRERLEKGQQEGSYTLNHTNSIFILDKKGNWRINHSGGAKAKEIVHDIFLLLNAKSR